MPQNAAEPHHPQTSKRLETPSVLSDGRAGLILPQALWIANTAVAGRSQRLTVQSTAFCGNAIGMIDDVDEGEQQTGTRLHLEMALAVPPEHVFAAFVDAEQLRRWWGPAGFTVSGIQFEAVEGTDYRITMQPPDGDEFHIRGTFRAVQPPHRLSFTFIYEEPDPDDQETVVTLTLDPADSGTRLTLDQGPFRTPARLELHREGWTQTVDRLDRSLV
jgi:uncharacterized protein YndB with AHSA1/START domain